MPVRFPRRRLTSSAAEFRFYLPARSLHPRSPALPSTPPQPPCAPVPLSLSPTHTLSLLVPDHDTGSIPSAIGGLSSLYDLDLHGNMLSGKRVCPWMKSGAEENSVWRAYQNYPLRSAL